MVCHPRSVCQLSYLDFGKLEVGAAILGLGRVRQGQVGGKNLVMN